MQTVDSSPTLQFIVCSSAFADPPPPNLEKLSLSAGADSDSATHEPLIPLDQEPSTLIEWAVLILNTPDPDLKAP